MADNTFTCNVLTPEDAVLETQASFAAIPACDGEIGILHGRAPLLCRLGVGILRLQTGEGLARLFVDGGFAEVSGNKLTILTDQALAADQVDPDEERAALSAARQRRAMTIQDQEARRREMTRAAIKIKLASAKSESGG